MIIETFRFYHEYDNEYEIFSVLLKKGTRVRQRHFGGKTW